VETKGIFSGSMAASIPVARIYVSGKIERPLAARKYCTGQLKGAACSDVAEMRLSTYLLAVVSSMDSSGTPME